DNHAVIEQDMQDVEQRQFRPAPRPSSGSEGTADFAFERPRVALDGDLVEEPFHFPLYRAKTSGGADDDPVSRGHVRHRYLLNLHDPSLDPFGTNALGHGLHHRTRLTAQCRVDNQDLCHLPSERLECLPDSSKNTGFSYTRLWPFLSRQGGEMSFTIDDLCERSRYRRRT